MSIISKETWDKFSEEEKRGIYAFYEEDPIDEYDRGYKKAFDMIFGKETLQNLISLNRWQ